MGLWGKTELKSHKLKGVPKPVNNNNNNNSSSNINSDNNNNLNLYSAYHGTQGRFTKGRVDKNKLQQNKNKTGRDLSQTTKK